MLKRSRRKRSRRVYKVCTIFKFSGLSVIRGRNHIYEIVLKERPMYESMHKDVSIQSEPAMAISAMPQGAIGEVLLRLAWILKH